MGQDNRISLQYANNYSQLMASSSSIEIFFVSCAPPWFGCVSCNIEVERALAVDGDEGDFSMEAVEAEELSTKEFAVEDDESSMEEPEVKLGGKGLSERGRISSGGRARWTVECWLRGRFLELLGGHSFRSLVGPFSFPLGR